MYKENLKVALNNQPPGPKGHWLTGSLKDFRNNTLGFLTDCSNDYGDIVSFRLGPHSCILVVHPDQIEQVLLTENRNFSKHYALDLLRPSLGNGLVTSNGDFWKRQRRIIQPAFDNNRLMDYSAKFVCYSQQLSESWNHGQQCDIHAEMMQLTLQIVASTLLNVDLKNNGNDVKYATNVILEDFNRRYHSLLPIPVWMPTPNNLRLKNALHRLNSLVQQLINERREDSHERDDLLSILVNARDSDDGIGMTDQQIRDEIVTLLMAGHETTANALSWTWYLLAKNPSAEAKLHDELSRVLNGRPLSAEDYPHLKYTESIILESMRMYPPAYLIGRRALQDCQLGNYPISAGTTIMLSQWVTHQDARFFDSPDDFQPERWENSASKSMLNYAYFPFGGGPRVCIGNKFSLIESVLILASIASRFRVELTSDQPIEPWASATLRPLNGINVRLLKH